MKRKISLILVMAIFAFSIAGCGSDKSGDNAKADNTTSTTQETQSITKKEQSTAKVKNEESSKSEEASSEAAAGEEVAIAEDNNDVNNAVTGDDIKEPEKSEEVISEVVAEEPAKEEPAKEEPAKEEPAKTDNVKEEITSMNADKIVSGNFTNDTDEAIANEFVKNFGRRTLKKGDVIDLRDYCDFDSFSDSFKAEFLTGMANDIEENYNHDLNSTVFTFNVFNEADMVIVVGVTRRGTHHCSAYVKK
ncbi:MAG: hypothetical protein PUD10_02620 [Lachnospira sp.]|nr:hypothetical protein [Lachnospira sp.]